MIQGSRLLNDNATFFGLNVYDLMASIAVLVCLSEIFDGTVFELLPLVGSIGLLVLLAPIRLRCRRKIVRDFATYYLRRVFTGGLVYDPRRHR